MTRAAAHPNASPTTTFEQDGYLVARGVLSPSTTEQVRRYLAAEALSAVAGLTDHLQVRKPEELLGAIDSAVVAPEFSSREKADRDVMTGHYPLDVRLSHQLWAIPRDAGLRELLTDLLASDQLYMHMPPTARFVLPHSTHAAVPPHQDLLYGTHMSNFITVWTPLVKIDEECGGVAVYRGSGDAPPLKMSSAGAVWFDGVTTEGYEKVHITCDVGDVLVMNNHLIHTSMPNRSDRTRISVDCRYFGSNGHSKKHYLDMQDWQVVAPAVGESNGPV